jgi:hypothetical protein
MEGFTMSTRSKLTIAFQLVVALAVFLFLLEAPFWLWGFVLFLDLLLTPDTRPETEN